MRDMPTLISHDCSLAMFTFVSASGDGIRERTSQLSIN